jgi:DNA-binding NtrC family response regulator
MNQSLGQDNVHQKGHFGNPLWEKSAHHFNCSGATTGFLLRDLILCTENMHTDRYNAQDTADLVFQKLLNPDITLKGPIRLKEITRQATRDLERKIILKVLEAQHWNRKRTAEVLSMSYRGLLYKMKEAGL